MSSLPRGIRSSRPRKLARLCAEDRMLAAAGPIIGEITYLRHLGRRAGARLSDRVLQHFRPVPLLPERPTVAPAPVASKARPPIMDSLAGVAQLVEHHLAKVRVAGSSPVARSKRNAGQGPFPGP